MTGLDNLLIRFLGGHDIARSIVGDLRQELASRGRSGLRASLWYAWAGLGLVVRYQWSRRTTRERHSYLRPRRSAPLGTTLRMDLRSAARSVRGRPWMTLTAVLTLALGVGATSAMFSLADVVLWRPLAYPDATHLVRIGGRFPDGIVSPVAPPMFRDWQSQSTAFRSIAGLYRFTTDMTDAGSEPRRLQTVATSASFGQVFGVTTSLGRWFGPADDRVDAPPVVVLGPRVWQDAFHGDPRVVGRTVNLDGRLFTVIGVVADAFVPPENLVLPGPMLWIPLAQSGLNLNSHANFMVRVVGTLAQNRSKDSAAQELSTLSSRLIKGYPADSYDDGFSVQIQSLREATLGSASNTLYPYWGAALFLLLIAIVNVTNLFLARTSERTSEFALRLALGASRWRLARQVLTESVLLSGIAGAAGVVLASGALAVIRSMNASGLPRLAEVGLDFRMVTFDLGLSLVAALALGLLPSVLAGRQPMRSIRSESPTLTSSGSRVRFRHTLVAVQTAMALILLVGTGLMIHSLMRLNAVDPGFRRNHVVVMNLALANRYKDRETRLAFFSDLRTSLRSSGAFADVGLASGLPFGSAAMGGSIMISGKHGPREPEGFVRWQLVDDGFFDALSIAAQPGGRLITPEDLTAAAPPVVVVNERFAHQYWPDEPAIGQRLQVVDTGDDAPWRTVVGVVSDFKQGTLKSDASAEVYLPFTQSRIVVPDMHVVAWPMTADSAAALRASVRAIDGAQPVNWIAPLDDRISRSTRTDRFRTLLLGIFGSVAWLLSLVGIYATVTQTVGARARELSIRAMLGASTPRLWMSSIGGLLGSVGTGIAMGLIGSWWLAALIQDQLFDLSPRDPGTTAMTVLVFVLGAALAAIVPIRRSTALHPLHTLRR